MDQRSKIAVIGFGVEGRAMLKFLVDNRYGDVTICDEQVRLGSKMPDGVSVRLGEHYLDGLEEFDVIFRSPGVPHHHPEIVMARTMGKEVTSPTQFFLDHCPCTVIGVTGTKGKGTTSTLIYEILKAGLAKGPVGRDSGKGKRSSGRGKKPQKVYLGGNIGNPPIEFLDKLEGSDVVVLELSCFQLGDLKKSPSVAVLLNTTMDHLDYYPDVDEYMRAKELILSHQDKNDLAILNKDYEYVKYYKPLVKGKLAFVSPKGEKLKDGCFVDRGKIMSAADGKTSKVCLVKDIALIGSHNLENVCPAVLVGLEFGVPARIIRKAVRKFKGLPHRLEFVRKVKGVSFYNDSFSTNPFTSMAAVDSFDKPTCLIAGGYDKGLSYDDWAMKILTKASLETVVLMGNTAKKMVKALDKARDRLGRAGSKDGLEATPTKIIERKDLVGAVEAALKVSQRGGVVVMSPAAASFDQFKDYKERGKTFRDVVTKLRA